MRAKASLTAWLIGLATLTGSMDSLAAEQRRVRLAWREVDDAVTYHLEVAKNPQMDPLIINKHYRTTSTWILLPPGTYYFRARGIDAEQAPGPWSDVEGFVVNATAPGAVSPKPNWLFKAPLNEDGIEFRWSKGVGGSEYWLEIRDSKGIVLKRSVDGTSLEWMPPNPGRYAWRVGYKTPTGEEWGGFQQFAVYPSALPVTATVSALQGGPPVEDFSKPRPSRFWLIGRAAQANAAYKVSDPDRGITASGSAFVSFFSAELRWQGGRDAGQSWTWSGAVNYELIRQGTLGDTFNLSRYYARLFLGKETGGWRVGPFVQAQVGQSLIFMVENGSSAVNAIVSRKGLGVGGVVVYRPTADIGLSALALIRVDSGGEHSALSGPLKTNAGIEAGFGGTFLMSERWMVEGRLRFLQEKNTWDATAGGLGSMMNSYVLIDAGVAFRF